MDRPERSDTADPLAALAELAELARRAPDKLSDRLAALPLREQAELSLRLPPASRLELLLHAPQPMRLVRALPDLELYLTVREVGPTDALPLLALASAAQLRHLLDLEAWRGDRFDGNRAGAWLALALESGEPTLRRLLRASEDELLALLFQRWLRIAPAEGDGDVDVHGLGQTETGDERGLLSPDGSWRVRPSIAEHTSAARQILDLFFRDQPDRYRRAMWTAAWQLPAELEEEALHWRQSRLEEHGFPSPDEALAVYAPPAGQAARPDPPAAPEPDALAVPRLPLRLLSENEPLAGALALASADERERWLHELLAVANRLLVADGADTGDPRSHADALRKASGYLDLALESRGATARAAAHQVLADMPVLELFREGYARATALGARARRLVREGWAAAHPRAISLLDPPLDARVRALSEARPLYVDLSGERPVLRGFRRQAEIEETTLALGIAEALGEVLIGDLGLDVASLIENAAVRRAAPPRLGVLLVTALAWQATGESPRLEALPPERAARFLRERLGPGDLVERDLATLAESLTADARRRAVVVAWGRAAIERLRAECADPTAADPRALTLLWIAAPRSA